MGKDFYQLVADLKNNDPNIRESAIRELGYMCDERTVDPFVYMMMNHIIGDSLQSTWEN